MTEETRIYKTRDSATAVLRKLGIAPAVYATFIFSQDDGTYKCAIGAAKLYLEGSNAKATTEPKVEEPTAKAAAEPRAKRAGLANTIREMIVDGMSNEDIWAAVKEKHNLDDRKKHYPGWYRCEMKRKGLL